jgi:hypothetical protein
VTHAWIKPGVRLFAFCSFGVVLEGGGFRHQELDGTVASICQPGRTTRGQMAGRLRLPRFDTTSTQKAQQAYRHRAGGRSYAASNQDAWTVETE